jgi:hypothetical protein
VFLDRWRRQRVLVVSNIVKAAVVVGVATLVAAGNEGLPFFVTALVALGVNRFFLSALSAALPHVVRADELVIANAVSTTSGTVATVVGVGIGGGLRLGMGAGNWATGGIVVASAVVYLLSSLAATRMQADSLGPQIDGDLEPAREAIAGVIRSLIAGARHLRHRPSAAQALAAITAHRFCYGVATLSTVLLFRNYFHQTTDVGAGIAGFGLVIGATGAGVLVGAALTPFATRHLPKQVWVVVLLLVAAAVQLVFGLPFTQPTQVVGAFLLGIVAQGAKICVDTLVQEGVDDGYRGRVFTLYDMAFNVSYVAAAGVAAVALPITGRAPAVIAALAVGYLLTALLYAWGSHRITMQAASRPESSSTRPLVS